MPPIISYSKHQAHLLMAALQRCLQGRRQLPRPSYSSVIFLVCLFDDLPPRPLIRTLPSYPPPQLETCPLRSLSVRFRQSFRYNRVGNRHLTRVGDIDWDATWNLCVYESVRWGFTREWHTQTTLLISVSKWLGTSEFNIKLLFFFLISMICFDKKR